MYLVLLLLSLAPALAAAQTPPPDCATRDTCQAEALIAEAAGEFERFHDLAWRAVQKGKPNDPELMVMLSRAMALSGRPGDAIVMLSRLADMGVKVDASGDEYRVVRTLKEWPEVEAKLARLAGPAAPDQIPAASGELPASTTDLRASKSQPPPAVTGEGRAPNRELPAATGQLSAAATGRMPAIGGKLEPSSPPAARPELSPGAEPGAKSPEPEFSFEAPAQGTSGLAYDAVSRRWLMGDHGTAGLLVVDEISHRVVPLVSGAGAGFYSDLTAFRIDERRGDLWVVSAREDGDRVESVLHKLQLVSGRPMFEVQPASFGDVRFVDVAVAASGTVYALDAAGSRLLRLRPGMRAFELAAHVTAAAPVAFDVVDDQLAYVAGSAGITRVDLATGRGVLLKSEQSLDGVAGVDARGRSLFLLQRRSEGERLVRCTLDRTGRNVASMTVVDAATAMARAGGRLYYVSAPGVIKSVRERP